MNRTHRKILTSATAAAVLALAACSSQESDAPADGPNHGGSPAHGGDPQQTPTFDYSMPELGPVTVDELIFELPQVVLDNEPEYVENRMFDSISIKPMQISAAGLCGVEINYELHNDPAQRMYEVLLDNTLPRYDIPPEDRQNLSPERARQLAEDAVAGGKRKPESSLDLANPKKGRYVSDDLTRAQVIGDCAKSTDSGEALTSATYKMVGQGLSASPGSTRSILAESDIGVFSNGDVFIRATDIKGWEQDSNGDWIPN